MIQCPRRLFLIGMHFTPLSPPSLRITLSLALTRLNIIPSELTHIYEGRTMRHRAFCVILALAALAITQSFAASYTIDVIVPETGSTGAMAATYQQWRHAAQLASADVADLWASTGDTLTVQILDNQNSPALNIQQASSSTAIAVIGAGSDAMTEQAALALQSRGVRLSLPIMHHLRLFLTFHLIGSDDTLWNSCGRPFVFSHPTLNATSFIFT